MANLNPKRENLIPQKPKWKHLPTKAIRVPEIFVDKLEQIAIQWDNNQIECTQEIEQLSLEDLRELKDRVEGLIQSQEEAIKREPALERQKLREQSKPQYNHQLLAKYELNQRQADYLIAIFNEDQQREKWEKEKWVMHNERARPASVWRWMDYWYFYLTQEGSELHNRMVKEGCIIDQGTGSTFAALAARNFIETQQRYLPDGIKLTRIKLTRKGRQVARELLDIKPQKKGILTEAKWTALMLVFDADETEEIRDWGYQNYTYTWTPLIKAGLVQEIPSYNTPEHRYYSRNRFVITEKGKTFYLEHYQEYQQLYSLSSNDGIIE